MFRLSKVVAGKSFKINWPLILEGKGKVFIGDYVSFERRVNIGVAKEASLKIGNNSRFEENVLIRIGKNATISIGSDSKIGRFTRIYTNSSWEIGSQVMIASNCDLFARENVDTGELRIGQGTHIGDGTIIDLCQNVKIGNYVAIGPNCTIYTHDHKFDELDMPAWKGGLKMGSVNIGDGAWIGSNVTILHGIMIGDRAIIAAGAVVNKDVEANTIVGGVPARVLRKISNIHNK